MLSTTLNVHCTYVSMLCIGTHAHAYNYKCLELLHLHHMLIITYSLTYITYVLWIHPSCNFHLYLHPLSNKIVSSIRVSLQCTLNVHSMHLTSRFAVCEMYTASTRKVHSTYVQEHFFGKLFCKKKPVKFFLWFNIS